MKKFTVKPRLFRTSQALVGSSEQDSEEWILLGRLSEAGQLTTIRFDVNKPQTWVWEILYLRYNIGKPMYPKP